MMHEEHAFSDLFLAFLLGRSMPNLSRILSDQAFQLQQKSVWREFFCCWRSLVESRVNQKL